LYTGRDFLGADRSEGVLSATTVLFLNPQHRYTVYVPAGLFHSWAHVKPVDQPARKYRYFGAFLGLGVECTLNARWSVFADLLGFLRGRTDQRSVNEPEYVDLETGNVTNSSGGGLLRVGGAFYF
jgi:hypothetical protein